MHPLALLEILFEALFAQMLFINKFIYVYVYDEEQ